MPEGYVCGRYLRSDGPDTSVDAWPAPERGWVRVFLLYEIIKRGGPLHGAALFLSEFFCYDVKESVCLAAVVAVTLSGIRLLDFGILPP